MDARLLNEDDYETLVGWWKDNRFTPPPKDSLPENGTCGVMVSKDGREICAGFIYFTNSSMAWCEYIVADFNYREDDRSDAIKKVINSLSYIAKSRGVTTVFTSLNSKNLIGKYEDCGFIQTSKGCTEMIKIL